MVKIALGLVMATLLGLAWLIAPSLGSMNVPQEPQDGALPSEWQSFREELARRREVERPVPLSNIPHDEPPPPALFAEDRLLQEIYDNEAQPGQFVTPPAAVR